MERNKTGKNRKSSKEGDKRKRDIWNGLGIQLGWEWKEKAGGNPR